MKIMRTVNDRNVKCGSYVFPICYKGTRNFIHKKKSFGCWWWWTCYFSICIIAYSSALIYDYKWLLYYVGTLVYVWRCFLDYHIIVDIINMREYNTNKMTNFVDYTKLDFFHTFALASAPTVLWINANDRFLTGNKLFLFLIANFTRGVEVSFCQWWVTWS